MILTEDFDEAAGAIIRAIAAGEEADPADVRVVMAALGAEESSRVIRALVLAQHLDPGDAAELRAELRRKRMREEAGE